MKNNKTIKDILKKHEVKNHGEIMNEINKLPRTIVDEALEEAEPDMRSNLANAKICLDRAIQYAGTEPSAMYLKKVKEYVEMEMAELDEMIKKEENEDD